MNGRDHLEGGHFDMATLFFKIKRRLLWRLFSLLPKDMDKVELTSFYGRGYSDSPRAIAEVLRQRGDYKLYWTCLLYTSRCV